MSNCAIVGINWGDEGKGRMVDYLTGQYDVVVRYQGGGNAGHTVIKPVESWQVVYALLIKIVPHEYPLHDNRGYFAGKG